MKNDYYRIPLDFKKLKQKNSDWEYCSFKESIAQNIYLLVTSHFGEHRFDSTYGSKIWESDFQHIGNVNSWTEKVRKSLEDAILTHEKRLKRPIISLELIEKDIVSPSTGIRSIKKCLIIKVTATNSITGESFIFEMQLFISPLSLD
jgi:phage baseplate assembly protein W